MAQWVLIQRRNILLNSFPFKGLAICSLLSTRSKDWQGWCPLNCLVLSYQHVHRQVRALRQPCQLQGSHLPFSTSPVPIWSTASMPTMRRSPHRQNPLPAFHRTFSSSSRLLTVPLACTRHDPPPNSPSSHPPIILMHGLFGSQRNNRTMSKYAIPHPPPPSIPLHLHIFLTPPTPTES